MEVGRLCAAPGTVFIAFLISFVMLSVDTALCVSQAQSSLTVLFARLHSSCRSCSCLMIRLQCCQKTNVRVSWFWKNNWRAVPAD